MNEEPASPKPFDWTELFDAIVKKSEAEKKALAARQAGLLKERAAELAAPLASADTDLGEQYVFFRLGDEKYALRSRAIADIIMVPVITAVPKAPAEVAGVFSRRGSVYLALDTKLLLGIPPAAPGTVALSLANLDVNVALVVDDVKETRYVASSDIREGALNARAFVGITEDQHIVLDAAALWGEAVKALGLGA